MSKYAASTSVSANASRDEIERTLIRYGADQFLYGWNDDAATIGFRLGGRHIRFVLPMPRRDEQRFTHHSRGARTPEAATKEWDQAVRQRWRALALVIKAKLEAVDSGISIFDDEFLANIVLPDGQTAGDWMRPQVAEAYRISAMPSMLPMLPGIRTPAHDGRSCEAAALGRGVAAQNAWRNDERRHARRSRRPHRSA